MNTRLWQFLFWSIIYLQLPVSCLDWLFRKDLGDMYKKINNITQKGDQEDV